MASIAVSGTRTTCPYCGVGCGVLARVGDDGGIDISGDPDHPANQGRLCSKGAALADTLSLDDRLLTPTIGGRQTGWREATDLVARRFSETIAEHGPDSVAFYASGQLLTEDYYVANKLMKGFIGSANIDTNSRLCMASAVSGHRRAFGSDTVPGVYEDLEHADLVVLVGSNLAWCHPVLFQRLAAAREARGTKVVVIDPRRTATAEIADLHLALAPGSDVALFNGLLDYLEQVDAIDMEFIGAHTNGIGEALLAARASDFESVLAATGLSRAALSQFYEMFARTTKAVTVFSQGVNQSRVGTDKVNAILNLHLATGRIGRPGMGPFSVTGQPNAMGGREVGGLANSLAAHMDIENPDHRRSVQAFWRSPRIADKPGLKAVDLFRAVGDGRIKALWIMATNPVVSMPDADAVAAALDACPFVVVSDVTGNTDTARHADVLLPAAAWAEREGTVTNSERRISRQRAFLPLPGEARPDWWIVSQVAKRMGHDGFDYGGPSDIFREHAALTTVGNRASRDLDLGGLADLSNTEYAALKPVQWPVPADDRARKGGRFFADGQFFTDNGRAWFVPTPAMDAYPRLSNTDSLVLNTGRIRDQWHTMTRTAKAPRLMTHIAEPFVEIHPTDAARHGLTPATLALIESKRGSMVARVLVTDRQRPGSVFAPMHWTDQLASKGRVDAVVAAVTDPVSGQPELKLSAVTIKPYPASWYGFAVLRHPPSRRVANDLAGYWVLARAKNGWRIELAGTCVPDNWGDWARTLFSAGKSGLEATGPDAIGPNEGGELLAFHDVAAGRHRFASFNGEQLHGALFVAPEPVSLGRGFITDALTAEHEQPADRLRLLAGRPGADRPDPGAIVCSCFEVGANQIADAVIGRHAMSVEAVGALLNAGTNCGSCRPEIGRIVDAHAIKEAV